MPWEVRERFIVLVVALIAAGDPVAAEGSSGGEAEASMTDLVDQGLTEVVLGDGAFLEEEGYLSADGTVPVLLELDERVPHDAAGDAIGNAMAQTNTTFAPGLRLEFTHTASPPGTVTFELAIGTQDANLTAASVTITDEMGTVVNVVELAHDHTREDGPHVWTALWDPAAERALG